MWSTLTTVPLPCSTTFIPLVAMVCTLSSMKRAFLRSKTSPRRLLNSKMTSASTRSSRRRGRSSSRRPHRVRKLKRLLLSSLTRNLTPALSSAFPSVTASSMRPLSRAAISTRTVKSRASRRFTPMPSVRSLRTISNSPRLH